MTNILITGGTGFIGSYIARRLVDEGHKVICFDNFIDPPMCKFIGQPAIFHKGDITHIEEIISVLREYDVEKIISVAFLMGSECEEKLQLAVRVNSLGVNNVFEAGRLCRIKRIAYASSIGVYGNFSGYGDRPVREVPEDFHPPNNVYGAAKQFNEFMAGRYNENYGMEIVCIRVSLVFGRGRVRNLWIDNMISDPLRGIPAHIPQKSNQKANLIYVKDLAEIFRKIINAPKVRHWIYNSGGHTITWKEFSEIIKNCIPRAEFTFDEEALPLYLVYAVDNSLIKNEFELTLHSLEENVADQIEIIRQAEGL